MIEFTVEWTIKYLKNALSLNDFLRNMLRLSRFNIVPIIPIGTIMQRTRISSNQVDLTLERNKAFWSTVVSFIFEMFYFI